MAEDKPKPPCKECGKPSVMQYGYCYECGLAAINGMLDTFTKIYVVPQRCTDLGNMERLIARYGTEFRFTKGMGWLHYEGNRWEMDDTGKINQSAHAVARRIMTEAARVKDGDGSEEIKKGLVAWSKASEAKARLDAMVSLAQSSSEVSTKVEAFDQDTNLFNCGNATINLRTGTQSPHSPGDMLTKMAHADYNKDAKCVRWLRFVLEIMDGNQEMGDFLQRAIGYSLTGNTSEHCMFILWGSGSNGKTTFVETVKHVLGTYAQTADFNTFVLKKWGAQSGPSSDIAKLRGARFVSASEAEEGQKLAESLIKQITGGDSITACFKFKEHFEFTPQLKLWLSTNHKPQIVGTDDGIWRRIRLVPFNVKFDKDSTLGDVLKAEAPGILLWALEGLKQWQEHGLMEPQTVLDATTTYRADEDIIERFINEECEKGDDLSIGAHKLYERYKDWAKDNHELELSERKFADAMKEKGFKKSRNMHGVAYMGIGRIGAGNQEPTMTNEESM
jgi:putative DNA primase/helicase